MRHTQLYIAFGLAFCLISCNNSNTKTNNGLAEQSAIETPAAADNQTAPNKAEELNLDLKIGAEIPVQMEGYTIERQTYMAEGGEQVKFAVKKGNELIAELEPGYDFDTDAFNNKIEVINIFSEKYLIDNNLHVGSHVADVMAAYPDGLLTIYTIDGNLKLEAGQTQFFVDEKYYDGQLPEVQSIEGAIIEHPTFKPDAVVSRIRMY